MMEGKEAENRRCNQVLSENLRYAWRDWWACFSSTVDVADKEWLKLPSNGNLDTYMKTQRWNPKDKKDRAWHMPEKVFSHPAHLHLWVFSRKQLDFLSCLETFHLSSKDFFQFWGSLSKCLQTTWEVQLLPIKLSRESMSVLVHMAETVINKD